MNNVINILYKKQIGDNASNIEHVNIYTNIYPWDKYAQEKKL